MKFKANIKKGLKEFPNVQKDFLEYERKTNRILKKGYKSMKSNCDDCYWVISDKRCHMKGRKMVTDGTCNRYRKSDNKGAIQRIEG